LKNKGFQEIEKRLTVHMIHHRGLTLLEFLQSSVSLLELLGGLLVSCTLLLKKAAQFLDFCFGTRR
jgi:hypothetical protein